MKNSRLEKTMQGLICCANGSLDTCKQCPYRGTLPLCTSILLNDAIELLKEQDTQLGTIRLILNAYYGKEAMEELK